jgi:two-component sensor histidine kinase
VKYSILDLDKNAITNYSIKNNEENPAFPDFVLKKIAEVRHRDSSFKMSYEVSDVMVDGDNYWLALHADGLVKFQMTTAKQTKYTVSAEKGSINSNELTCLLMEKSGDLWIGTVGGGLNYFDRKKNTFYHYTIENGLCDNSVYSLVKDGNGRLWIGTGNGLSCFDIAANTFKNFYRSDGLVNSEYNRYSACKFDNGAILMGGTSGLDYFFPDSLVKKEIKPSVQITDFRVYNKSINIEQGLTFDHDQNYLSIRFASLDFDDPAKNEYMYKLEGINKEWIFNGKDNSVNLAALAPGHYRFLVKGSNSRGVWNDQPVMVEFTIKAPWWKQTWFLAMISLFSIGILYGIYRFRVTQLKKLIAVRTRISQDLHDEVGATLTGISLLSEVARQQANAGSNSAVDTIDKIGTDSREMIEEMNDIVWMINPANDKLDRIINRMEDFASPLLAAKNIRFGFDADDHIGHQILNMGVRKELYLIFKEAVNNAVKYSACTVLKASLKLTAGSIEMDITDNGKGFDMATANKGNGLWNLKARAESINGKLSISSSIGEGTRIYLKVPIAKIA